MELIIADFTQDYKIKQNQDVDSLEFLLLMLTGFQGE